MARFAARRSARYLLPAALAIAAATAACGAGSSGNPQPGGVDAPSVGANGGTADAGGGANTNFGAQPAVTSLALDPPQAAVDVVDGVAAPLVFRLIATFADGTKAPVTSGVAWSTTAFAIGKIDGVGTYTASGQQGGVTTVSAKVKGVNASAKVTVRLVVHENAAVVDSATRAALEGASATDATATWAYPYDGTVFPRGLAAPSLMWNGGAAGDAYLVRVESPTYVLESFSTTASAAAPASRFTLAQPTWNGFVESTTGAASLTVTRLSKGAATVIAKQRWTVSPASMAGTIYYWANNKGRVLRIKPGASAPEDFSAGLLDGLPASGCTMTCHTVSADGSTLVSGGDTLGGTFDLKNSKVTWDEGGAPGGAQKRRWAYAALSPNGKYVLESFAPFPVGFGTQTGLFLATSKALVPDSGVDGVRLGTPAFAPDGSLIAYVDYQNGPTKGSLKLVDFNAALAKASNIRELVKNGTLPDIGFPSVSPDAKWVVYQRGEGVRTDGGRRGDLYIASTITGVETRLGQLDGDAYPFAAGDRDRNWNFEPTFAPVASGGYFWVVLTSRRTLGNELTDTDLNTKQLWVAAIDQNPTPGTDPSHPAFHLPGQGMRDGAANTPSLNMRGFWSLEACKADAQACETGSQCCGGYCDKSAGAGVCKSAPSACSHTGDRCQTAADCCEASSGASCINHVCAEATPR